MRLMPSATELAATLRARVEGMRQGERMPSINELAEAEGVTWDVARRAYRVLVRAGLVESRRGDGYYVLSPAAPPRTLEERLAELERWRREDVDPRLDD